MTLLPKTLCDITDVIIIIQNDASVNESMANYYDKRINESTMNILLT